MLTFSRNNFANLAVFFGFIVDTFQELHRLGILRFFRLLITLLLNVLLFLNILLCLLIRLGFINYRFVVLVHLVLSSILGISSFYSIRCIFLILQVFAGLFHYIGHI